MLLKIFFLIEATSVSLSLGPHSQLLKNFGGSFAIVSCLAMIVNLYRGDLLCNILCGRVAILCFSRNFISKFWSKEENSFHGVQLGFSWKNKWEGCGKQSYTHKNLKSSEGSHFWRSISYIKEHKIPETYNCKARKGKPTLVGLFGCKHELCEASRPVLGTVWVGGHILHHPFYSCFSWSTHITYTNEKHKNWILLWISLRYYCFFRNGLGDVGLFCSIPLSMEWIILPSWGKDGAK